MRPFFITIVGVCLHIAIFANELSLKQLTDSTKAYWNINTEKALKFANQAIQLCDGNNSEIFGECLKNKGVVFYFASNPDSASYYYEKALKIFKTGQYKMGESKVLNNLGILKMENGDYNEALNYYHQSITLGKEQKDTTTILHGALNLSNIYYALGNYSKALNSCLEIGDLINKSTDWYTTSNYYSALYSNYRELNDFRNFEKYAQKALTLYQQNNDSIGMATTYTNMANAFELNNQFQKSIQLNTNALNIFKRINYTPGIIHAQNGLAYSYRNTKKYKTSTTYFENAYHEAAQAQLNDKVKQLANELYINWLILGDNYYARYYQNIHDSLNNRLMNSEIKSQIAEYEVKYETLEKELKIKDLSAEKVRHQLVIKNEKQKRSLITIVAFLITIAGAGSTIIYRIRQKNKRTELARTKAEIENRLLRAQMNPHFMFNSLNSVQNFILKNDKMQACNYLSNFSDLMRNILQNSRLSFIPLDEELETLDKYLQLEQLRFKDKLNYTIKTELSIDASEINIPPMILQPYIENAIIHGIAPKNEMGNVNVIIENMAKNSHLKCTISDDGIGRKAAAKTKKTNSAKSLGMLVTSERLQQLQNETGIKAEVSIHDLYDEEKPLGTRVELIIPIEKIN